MSVRPPNYTQIPNVLLGNFSEAGTMADMNASELKVVLAVMRLTFGYHHDVVDTSISVIQRMTGLSRQSVLNGARAAEKRGILERDTTEGITSWCVLVQNLDQGGLKIRPERSKNLTSTGLKIRPYKERVKKDKEILGDEEKQKQDEQILPSSENVSLDDYFGSESRLPDTPAPATSWRDNAREPWADWVRHFRPRSGITAEQQAQAAYILSEALSIRPGSDREWSDWRAGMVAFVQSAKGNEATMRKAAQNLARREPCFRGSPRGWYKAAAQVRDSKPVLQSAAVEFI